MTMRPKQLLPDSKKNKEWQRDSVKYFRDACFSVTEDFDKQYALASGKLDESEYTYLTNPQNTQNKSLRAFPARLKNYPIIPSTIGVLLGEKRKRPVYSFVNILNSDVLSRRDREIGLSVKQSLTEMFNAELEMRQIDPEKQPVDIDIASMRQKASAKYKDIRAVVGQDVLDWCLAEHDIIEQFQKAYLYWITTSQAYSYRDVQNNRLVYRAIAPEKFGYIADEGVDYVEDGEACAYRFNITYSECIDRFGAMIAELDKDERDSLLEWLESSGEGTGHHGGGQLRWEDTDDGVEIESGGKNDDSDTVAVVHVNWKAKRKQKFLTYINDEGLTEKVEVPNGYVGKDDEVVEEMIINELWEGYEIGERWYLGIRIVPLRRGRMDNPSVCKLLYNGKMRKIGTYRAQSVTEIQEPYQHLVNFIRYKTILTIAKNKDNLLLFPISLIPDNADWDLDKIFYHVAADDFLFVNDYDNDAKLAMQHVRSLNMNMQDYIIQSFGLIQTIKREADEAIGLVPQRRAQVSPSQGVQAMQTAIEQSATINEDMFVEFEKFQERDLNAILDFGKYAFIDGKRAMYMNPENRQVLLDLTGENLENYVGSEFNVRAMSSGKEKEKIDYMRSNVQSLIQNGAKLSTVAEILEHDSSFAKIKEKLRTIEELEMQMQQQAQQADAERQQELAKINNDAQAQSDMMQIRKAEIAANAVITAASISAGARLTADAESLADKQSASGQKDAAGIVMDMERIRQDERKNVRDNAVKQYVADRQLDVAAENKD